MNFVLLFVIHVGYFLFSLLRNGGHEVALEQVGV